MASKEVYVEIEVMPLKQLVHNERNPRYIKSKKHAELMQSLKQFPEMKLLREIVVDEDNLILAGDKRVFALDELGYADVTVKKVFNLTQKQKDEFIAKDNIHHGEWDSDIIANQWNPEIMKDWGVPEFKLGGEAIEPENSGGPDQNDDGEGFKRKVTCPDCGSNFDPAELDD